MNNTLCSAAWTDINLDFSARTVRHCCKSSLLESFPENLTIEFLNNSAGIKKIRKQLLNGELAGGCNICWSNYEKTGTAYRDFKNTWKTKEDVSYKIKYIEIFLENICDMSCIYCDPQGSSKIASELKIKNTKNEKIEEDLNIFVLFLENLAKEQKVINLNFLGGEVTYSKSFFRFVEQLLENNILSNTNIIFSVLSNGNSSTSSMKKMINLLDRLPESWKIVIGLSIESSGEIAEKVRYGLSWQKFTDNLKIYYNHSKVQSLIISPTLSVFTVKTFPDFIKELTEIVDYKKESKLVIIGNFIEFPEVLNPMYADKKYKTDIADLRDFILSTNTVRNKQEFANFLSKLELMVGSRELNLKEIDNFIERMVKQKLDQSLYDLKKFL